MPQYKYGDEDNKEFVRIPDGEYHFEIIGFEAGIQSKGVTNGCENMELKVKFFKDKEFKVPLAQWTETFIFHPSCEWRIDTFAKCANFIVNGKPPVKGEPIEFTEQNTVGLRGICSVSTKAGVRDATKQFNFVQTWLTNKPKLLRNPDTEQGEEESATF